MFTRWGDLVFRLRYATIGVVVAALLGLGGYGLGLGNHLSSSGWDDPTSESAQAAKISDAAYGRDHTSDVIVLYSAPDGKTIDDPEWSRKIVDNLNSLPKNYPNEISKVNGAYWKTDTGAAVPATFGSKDRKHAFASIAIVGDNDTEMVRNFRKVKDTFFIPGVDVQVAGLQAVAGTLNDTMATDQKRMEMLAIPAVAVLLFFIFGGIVAAALPLIVGGLTVIGAWGIVRFVTEFVEVNSFVEPVVSMIGLGLAIDYGLFIVSRFREELAEGYNTRAAVRRSVMTAGRTVVFSATMIIASLGGMLLFPQGFLKSIAYGSIATVTLAALTAITILPAMLSILGPKVDLLGFKKFRKTKTAEEVENGFWGKSTRWVMQHPLKIAIPICILLLLLIIPVKNLAFGGINERYLPPDNPTRLAQAEFDSIFPLRKSDPIQLIFVSDNSQDVGKVWAEAKQAPGLAGTFEVPSQSTTDRSVYRTSATLADSENPDPTIEYLRSMDVPDDVEVYVGGQPVIQKDSIDALLDRMPWMIALVLLVTTLLMFLTFGSLVLPIKAALMSALGLGSTLGILTWIFIDGHGAGLLNFTPQPIMSPVLVLIIAVIYGLSVDYEVFLLSRMVEARTKGASTTEAVRIGTAQTGRIITAAALILLVVTGAFAFSDLVMMQYLAYGMVAALFIDATILRMLLVPATMKLLGDDCWWAPAWMKKVQEKIGLGEPILDDELPGGGELVDLVKTTPVTDPVTMQMPAIGATRKSPRRVRTIQEIEAAAPTVRLDSAASAKSAVSKPDPSRPMPPQANGSADAADPTARVIPPTSMTGTPRTSAENAAGRIIPPSDPTARVMPPDSTGGGIPPAGTPSDPVSRIAPPSTGMPGSGFTPSGSADATGYGPLSGLVPGSTGNGTPSAGTPSEPTPRFGPSTQQGTGSGFTPSGSADATGYGPLSGLVPDSNANGTPSASSADATGYGPLSGLVPGSTGNGIPSAGTPSDPTPRFTPPARNPSLGTPESGFTPSGPADATGYGPLSGLVPGSTANGTPSADSADATGYRPLSGLVPGSDSHGTPSAGTPSEPTPRFASPTQPGSGMSESRFTTSGSAEANGYGPLSGLVPDSTANGTPSAGTPSEPTPRFGPSTQQGTGSGFTPSGPADHTGRGATSTPDAPGSGLPSVSTGSAFPPAGPADLAGRGGVPGSADPNAGFTPPGSHGVPGYGSTPSGTGRPIPSVAPSPMPPMPRRDNTSGAVPVPPPADPGRGNLPFPQEQPRPRTVAPPPIPPTPLTNAGRTPEPLPPSAEPPITQPAEPAPRLAPPPFTEPAADPAARVQPPAPFPPSEPVQPTPPADDATPVVEGPDENRNNIENWMAELRSSRRRIGNRDEGRHHGGDGRTVSVNELLRRRENE